MSQTPIRYVALGDYFKGTGNDNPYDAKLIVKYLF